jgi:hypothetical protein
MDIVTSIGWLAIMAIAGGIIFHFISKKDSEEWENRKLIPNNDKCQDLIRKHNQAVMEGRPALPHHAFQKELKKILQDPKEKQQALDRIAQKEKEKEEQELERRNRRKVGYKYETEIFEIFDTEHVLDQEVLIKKIKLRYNTDDNQAMKLLKIWDENGLISETDWKSKKWKVGNVLTLDIYKIDATDLTRKTWLEQHGKTLKPKR